MKAVAIVSGGLDSTIMVYLAKSLGYDVHMVSFNYGQRHKKELDFAKQSGKSLGFQHDIINLSGLTKLLKGSALTDDSVEVPEGHYAEENMAVTVVPNRNAIMLSIAWGIAISDGAQMVGTAVHAGDHAIYPDCRPEFTQQLTTTLRTANEGYCDPEMFIWTPFIKSTKADIVNQGHLLGVPFEDTWSCYAGGDIHCGRCGTCVERIEAFRLAGVEDPTKYDKEGLKFYESLVKEGRVFGGHKRTSRH